MQVILYKTDVKNYTLIFRCVPLVWGYFSFHVGHERESSLCIDSDDCDANMMRDMVGGAGCGADGANPLAKMLQGVPKVLSFVQKPPQTLFYRLT